MTIMTNIIDFYKQFATNVFKFNQNKVDFKTTRKVFWLNLLCGWLTMFIIVVPSSFIAGYVTGEVIASTLIGGFFGIILSICLISTYTRRLMDAGYSRWWAIIMFIPYISWVAIIILGTLESKENLVSASV